MEKRNMGSQHGCDPPPPIRAGERVGNLPFQRGGPHAYCDPQSFSNQAGYNQQPKTRYMPQTLRGTYGGISQTPTGTYGGIPQTLGGTYGGIPQTPGGTYGGIPHMPAGTYGGIPQTPGGTYGGIPHTPAGTYGGIPQTPAVGIPQTPAGTYGGIPQTPAIGIPQTPAGTYAGISQTPPVGTYGGISQTLPAGTHGGVPQTLVGTYGGISQSPVDTSHGMMLPNIGQYPQHQANTVSSYSTNYSARIPSAGHVYGCDFSRNLSPSGVGTPFFNKDRDIKASMNSSNQDYPDQRERVLVENDKKYDSEEGLAYDEALDKGGKCPSQRTPSGCYTSPGQGKEIVKLLVPSFPRMKSNGIESSVPLGVDSASKVVSAAKVAYEEILASKKEVTLWKVVQTMLSSLKASSLESLGVNLHDVPYLKKLMLLEGKVNTLIHCHTAVRKITTLYDLEQDICQSEGVQDFNELGLGPLLVHPLVVHYFDPPALTEVYKITAEDVMDNLSAYVNKPQGHMLQVENFLSFMTKEQSLPSAKHLCVRLQNFGMHISILRRERKEEMEFSKRREKKAEMEFSKRQLDLVRARESTVLAQSQLPAIINRVETFLASTKNEKISQTIGCLDVISDGEDDENDENDEDDDKNTVSRSVNGKIMQLCGSKCPYPSAAEEKARLFPHLNHSSAGNHVTLSKQELEDFIATWKDVCRKNSVSEVLTRMLNFFGGQKGKNIKKKRLKKQANLFKLYPAIGLLNIAVMSIRMGHWDTIHDTLVDATIENLQQPIEMPFGMKDIGSASKLISTIKEEGLNSDRVLEDLLNLIEGDYEANVGKEQCMPFWVRGLLKSEDLIARKYGVVSFASLKLGNFSDFVEQHWQKLSDKIMLDSSANCGITSIPSHRLDAFICQVALAMKDEEQLSEDALLQLIIRQFNLQNGENLGRQDFDKLRKFLERKKKGEIIKSSLSFAAALLGTECTTPTKQQGEENANYRVGQLGGMQNSDAVKCLQNAPLLYDLARWSHWDLLFSPTLGPLLDWIESNGASVGLECIVTCGGGPIVRINDSASVDDFLSAILKESYREVATGLLSIVAKYGGVRHAPISLLKSHIEKGLKVLVMNYSSMDEGSISSYKSVQKRKADCIFEMEEKYMGQSEGYVKAVRLVLCSLLEVPSDFQVFAAFIFVPALSSVIPDAHIALLKACPAIEERSLLHKIGIGLGISEWINDLRLLVQQPSSNIAILKEVEIEKHSPVFVDNGIATSENIKIKCEDSLSQYNGLNSIDEKPHKKQRVDTMKKHALVDYSWMPVESEQEEKEARDMIKLIRQEEFGLDLDLEVEHQSLLSKQHARIGRALQCLSRELYSQDSHFVLELVQNADDNQYKAGVEAALVFVIQRNRIAVMNNELGFTVANMKALCDVGNSTKAGSAAGYIGHKGIGFKSVFRVTDAPEIHSRGFHVKFDISDGNLGFILPTLVPPVSDSGSFAGTLSAVEKVVGMEKPCWGTCMILPLKPSIAEGVEFGMLATKFNDIHPSLLLFLHRLRCVTVRDDVLDSIRIMRRVDMENGLVRVDNGEKKSNTWLVVSSKLKAGVLRVGVESTEIALAFPLQKSEDGERYYSACCEPQHVFAFLPLRPYGLKFIVQGDFVLPSSREEVDTDSTWNQWLLSEIPNVFIDAVSSFRKLTCFQTEPGKAASALMSYIPLEGEVQGFFSPLPRMLLSVLRLTECLPPSEDLNSSWALPCTLVEGWNDFIRKLIPNSLLKEHLGLRYLHRDVKLNPFLAASLGVHTFGASILVDLMRSLSNKKGALEELGPSWVGYWLVALYKSTLASKDERLVARHSLKKDAIYRELQSLAFIPLTSGTFTSVTDGPIWLPSGIQESGKEIKAVLEKYPLIYSELRIIHPLLLSQVESEDFKSTIIGGGVVATALEFRSLVCTMLQRVGVGQVRAHDIMHSHVLPCMGSDSCIQKDRGTILQYLCFIHFHLKSNCRDCSLTRSALIKQVREKVLFSTNNGYKRVGTEPIHFSVELGCPVDAKKIMQGTGVIWNEVDSTYLEFIQDGSKEALFSWRIFLKELGVTDFVQLVKVEKRHEKSVVPEWESPELKELLEGLCHSENLQGQKRVNQCTLLLLALDKLWEEYYSCCKVKNEDNQELSVSSFIPTMRRFQWVLSSFDGQLHHPTQLFHRCFAVESILGCHAPYASLQVQSKGLVSGLGLRTHVTTEDALLVLRSWSQQGFSFKESVAQMMRLYSFIWSKVTSDQEEILQFFKSGSFIFLPCSLANKNAEEISKGLFYKPEEVYWTDETGSLDFIIKSNRLTKELAKCAPFRTLKLVYPSMHGFFVDVLGIRESLGFSENMTLLKSLARMSSPCESWEQAMMILQKWSHQIQANEMSSEEVSKWKELLQDSENKILPTLQNKWVSLDPTMGLICWCDDDDLGKQFLDTGRIYFVLNGSTDLLIAQKGGKGTRVSKCPDISAFLKAMIVPSLSELVDREPIVYGAESSSQFEELLMWALRYAQRYLRHFHGEDYKYLQSTLFSNGFKHLRCLVANEIYFRYKLLGRLASEVKRIKCDYLLQGDTFYATGLEDMNAMFLEFSRLFFRGKTDLQLANFLHLITLSAHSGSEEREVDTFVAASQGIPPLPDGESCWKIDPIVDVKQMSLKHHMDSHTILLYSHKDPILRKAPKCFANNVWPPLSWLPPPRNPNIGHSSAVTVIDNAYQLESNSSILQQVSSLQEKAANVSETERQEENNALDEYADVVKEKMGFDESVVTIVKASERVEKEGKGKGKGKEKEREKNGLKECDIMERGLESAEVYSSVEVKRAKGMKEMSLGREVPPGKITERDQLQVGQPREEQQEATGRLGEALSFQYLVDKYGPAATVKWLNEDVESGSPFDFSVVNGDGKKVYIEVKATRSSDKDWFEISMREWEMAVHEGEHFVILRVFLGGKGTYEGARFLWLPDPVKLFQERIIKLAIVLPQSSTTKLP